MTDKELLQEALESIEWLRLHLERDHGCLHMKPAVSGITDWLNKTEAALCARLAQPEEKLFTEAQVLDIAQKLSDSAALNSVPIGWVKKKEWVGLTDDEKHSAIWTGGEFGDGVLWAEKLLKERNT